MHVYSDDNLQSQHSHYGCAQRSHFSTSGMGSFDDVDALSEEFCSYTLVIINGSSYTSKGTYAKLSRLILVERE